MRNRKIIKIGNVVHAEGKVIAVGGSMAVTLPKSWAKEHNLKLGDVVVKVANSMLIIAIKTEQTGG